jgi:hypothetical protein
MPRVDNQPMGENSPNLVTLASCQNFMLGPEQSISDINLKPIFFFISSKGLKFDKLQKTSKTGVCLI